jgi:hypothetical protein
VGDKDYIRQGGLMRCCSLSAQEAPDGQEGDVIGCAYHKDPEAPVMRFRDGAWEWIHPDDRSGV